MCMDGDFQYVHFLTTWTVINVISNMLSLISQVSFKSLKRLSVRPSPKSAMKVVMNIRVIMVTAEHYFSYVRLLLTKNFRKAITDHQ